METNDVSATLTRLREDFVRRLPQRMVALDAQLAGVLRGDKAAIEPLQRGARSLAGAADMHGLARVTEAARRLERAVAAASADSAGAESLSAMREALGALSAAMAGPVQGFALPNPSRGALPKVAVVDDDPEQAAYLRALLEAAGYEVALFGELNAFREACASRDEQPAAVIMDMIFPQDDDAGARDIAALKECIAGLPVIFLSARQDMAARLAAYRAGATRYFAKPVDRDALLRAVSESTALAPAVPYRVLLVDDDPNHLAVHALILRWAGMAVREESDPLLVLERMREFSPEALVLNMYMPQCSGPELAAILRDDPRYDRAPIVYLSVESDVAGQLLALNRGGDHFLTKPVDPRHLVAAVSLHARRFRQEREQAEALRSSAYERERQQQALDAHAIVSITDAAGTIRYVNDKFRVPARGSVNPSPLGDGKVR